MMLGSSGILNLAACGQTINEGEIRAAMPTGARMPNVVRVKVLAARKLLNLPNLKPRIEVSVRKVRGPWHGVGHPWLFWHPPRA